LRQLQIAATLSDVQEERHHDRRTCPRAGGGNRAYISGHLPLQEGGTLAEPRGKVGQAVTIEQGAAVRLVGLAMLGSLQWELSELERITAWLRVLGMVNVSPGTTQLARVINGFSALILDVFGPERGAHARSTVGMAELSFGVAVEIEAEVEIAERALAT
jgi:enamine deaminase RidA (YjgF/YER057c/UK114 family)